VCDVAGTKVSQESLETGIEIVTVTEIETETVTVIVTVDSMGGMEGLKRMDHLLEETVTEWASQAEMIEEVLGI
jgi:hypothetical protein